MIRFTPKRRSEDMTPIVRDVDLARYAEDILHEYRSELLRGPGRLDPYHFAEHYLGSDVLVHDIYTPDRKEKIAGAAIFRDGAVKVFDKENMGTQLIPVRANSILIDSDTAHSQYDGFEEFTMMHEAGHLLLHREVYRLLQSQDNEISGAALCKRSNIGGFRSSLKTNEDFREHQANTFSAFMLMPPRTFIPFVRSRILGSHMYTELGEDTVILKHADPDFRRTVPRNRIIREAMQAFGTSRSAVTVQMTRYGLASRPDKDSLYEARRRLKLYSSLIGYKG